MTIGAGRRRLRRAVPRPLRRGGTGRPAPDVRRCCATRRTSPWIHSDGARLRPRAGTRERGLTWLVRAAERRGPRRRSRSARTLDRHDPGRRLPARLVAPAIRTFRDAAGALVASVDIDWVLLDGRGAPTRIPPEFERRSGSPTATAPARAGRRSSDPPGDAASARRSRSGRRSSTRWTTSTTRSTRTGSTRRSSPPATRPRRGAIPRAIRLEYALAAEPGADARGPGVVGRRRLVVPAGRRRGRGHAPGAARAAAGRAGCRPGRG